jgi:Tfp pilus assembly protein PilF
MRFAVLFVVCSLAPAQSLDRAYESLRARDYDAAIAGFRKGIESEPARTSLRKDLAYTYLKIGENALARAQFREAMRLDPNDAPVAMEYAFLSFEAGEQAEARRIFDRIRKTGNPTAEQAFQNIDGPLAAGIARWKTAIEMGANDFSAHYELATLAEQRDELALAAEHYEKAWRLLPDRRSVLVDLGRVWLALDRKADATAALLAASYGGEARAAEMARALLPARYPYVSEFRHGLDFDSGNVELRRELAYLLLRMNRQAEAEQEFRDLADGPAKDLLATTQLAFLLHARGDDLAAQLLFDRVLVGKDGDLANRVRAVLHVEQTLQPRPAKAAPVALDAKVMAERSIKAGYIKDAVKYLEAAIEIDPGDPEVMLRLGWAYNILHQDGMAFHWFGRARLSGDPKVQAEADRNYRNLRAENELFRTTAWLNPMFSTRWHDAFGYAQVKTELRTGLGVRAYVSTRFVGDTRQTLPVISGPPQYLSESSVIVGLGLATTPWHGILAWGEAGRAFNYLTGHDLPDYRGGISLARGVGHTLRGESPGLFADANADAVFVSRFNKDVLFYNQGRFGYTAGPESFRLQLYGAANVVLDDQRQYWANFGQGGLGIRMSGSFLPPSMYFTFEAFRGAYLVNTGNPRRPNFYDFRAGFWYAFTH